MIDYKIMKEKIVYVINRDNAACLSGLQACVESEVSILVKSEDTFSDFSKAKSALLRHLRECVKSAMVVRDHWAKVTKEETLKLIEKG